MTAQKKKRRRGKRLRKTSRSALPVIQKSMSSLIESKKVSLSRIICLQQPFQILIELRMKNWCLIKQSKKTSESLKSSFAPSAHVSSLKTWFDVLKIVKALIAESALHNGLIKVISARYVHRTSKKRKFRGST